ncbi:MAG TPA: MerR family transcriptional regulator [Clostridiales bacterium]|nr:MerR family transcriptional regulator [Clostridiales bacterium]
MEYTINKLAKLAGVSTRTLRYYDEIGLLTPVRTASNGYRIYGPKEVDRLQQILFYRELGVPVKEIKNILLSEDFDEQAALQSHLSALIAKRKQLDLIIANVEKTLRAKKGAISMNDQEKFQGFVKKLVEDNERQYVREARERYGVEAVDRANAKLLGMSVRQYEDLEKLTNELNQTLKAACEQGDPSSELAQKACELHKKWLCYFWSDYSKEAHIGLAQMYVEDPRFTEYYDKIAKGCAKFLRDALLIYCG